MCVCDREREGERKRENERGERVRLCKRMRVLGRERKRRFTYIGVMKSAIGKK